MNNTADCANVRFYSETVKTKSKLNGVRSRVCGTVDRAKVLAFLQFKVLTRGLICARYTSTERVMEKNVTSSNTDMHADASGSLGKLADAQLEISKTFAKNEDRANARDHISQRVGMIVAVFLASIFSVLAVIAVLLEGPISLLFVVPIIIGVSHLTRVTLTGSWSETDWAQKIIGSLSKLSGERINGGPEKQFDQPEQTQIED